MLQLPAALSGYVKSGQVRLLASLTSARDPAARRCSHGARAGIRRRARGLARHRGSKGTPKSAIATLEGAIRKTAESPEFAQACEKLGVRPAFMPAGQFGDMIAKEDVELARIMQLIGLKK